MKHTQRLHNKSLFSTENDLPEFYTRWGKNISSVPATSSLPVSAKEENKAKQNPEATGQDFKDTD